MKKFLLPLFTVAFFTIFSYNGFSQQAHINSIPAITVAISQPVETAKLLTIEKPVVTKQTTVNCDAYLAIIATFQQMLQHASPAQKPGIIRAIARAREDYRKCKLSTVSGPVLTSKAVAQ